MFSRWGKSEAIPLDVEVQKIRRLFNFFPYIIITPWFLIRAILIFPFFGVYRHGAVVLRSWEKDKQTFVSVCCALEVSGGDGVMQRSGGQHKENEHIITSAHSSAALWILS